MKKNEGNFDRAFRIIIGIGLISLAFVGPKSPWAYLGFLPLLTGIFGICPMYQVFGISTYSWRKKYRP